jgi:hypothetical protein
VKLRSGPVEVPLTVRFWPTTSELWIDPDPQTALAPDVSYELQVDGLVDLDGELQPEPYRIVFTTGLALGPPAKDAVPRAVAALSLLAERCATSRCHAGASPAAGLDLSSAEGVERTAIAAASQLPGGTTGEEGARGALALAGLPIIDVFSGRGHPATSYLLYKVLGDEHILGERMPRGREPLSAADTELLAEWIAAGAPAP